ncbi:MAG: hypothetical protein PHV48_00700 [Candidatus Omnitrophica bacterium]|nr:hypothetical protein [Candidatus Omnitrophota bacterium]
MTAKYSKKGFISIFWIAVMMLITTAIMVTATYMFSTFAATPAEQLLVPLQNYYNAEFGISYGNFKIPTDPNIVNLFQNSSYTYNIPSAIIGADLTVTITRLHPDGSPKLYTIRSTANNRIITATWNNGILTQIN